MIIADTSGLLALFNDKEPRHTAAISTLRAAGEDVVVSPFVVAELDYLMATRVGPEAAVEVVEELSAGGWIIPAFGVDDLRRVAEVARRYVDQAVGVTDASLVVLAQRYRTRKVLTFDTRHFTVLRPLDGGWFTVLPSPS